MKALFITSIVTVVLARAATARDWAWFGGDIDGIYGCDTRDAVARYQNDRSLTVTGTLPTQTLQSLGVTQTTAS